MRAQRYWPVLVILMLLQSAVASAASESNPVPSLPGDNLPFSRWTKVVSIEGGLVHFGASRLPGNVQSFDLGAGFALMPFGITRFKRLHGWFDGALELGFEAVYARFIPPHQNFGGLAFGFRYNLVHFTYGRFVPWVAASIAPGGSDLDIGSVIEETRLTGPFMSLIRGEAGGSYFLNDHAALYVGLQAEHYSNAELNGADRNYSLNSPWGGVFGISWYFR
jgi:hypothetical protein